jgi:general secretion pathway protein E
VVKERVGSVRSQAAARYNASPAEIVAAAALPHPTKPRKRVDEDCIAESLAKAASLPYLKAASLPYLKIDPLRLDSNLITKTLSRPFVKRHVAVPLERDGEQLRVAITDPFDSMLLETLTSSIQAPLTYVVSSKRDVLAIIDRIYGLKTSITKAESELGDGSPGSTLVQLVELRSNADLASSDEHVIAAVDHLLTYASLKRGSGELGRARHRGCRSPPDLRLRAAGLRHPSRAPRRRWGGSLPDRRHPARHRGRAPRGSRRHRVPH